MSRRTRDFRRHPISPAWFLTALLVMTHGAVTSSAQAPMTVIEYTHEWKYLQATSAPAAWNTNSFDDSSWLTGRGTLAVPATESLPAGLVFNTLLSTNLGEGYIFTHHFRTRVT